MRYLVVLLLSFVIPLPANHIVNNGQQGFANHNPLFRSGPDITILESSGQYGPNEWCFDPVDGDGPRDMNNRLTHSGRQSISFNVQTDSPNLFAAGGLPAIGDNCALTFFLEAGQCGVAVVHVVLEDDGNPNCIEGIGAQGEVYTCPGACAPDDCSKSAPVEFHITVRCCNDPPSFQNLGAVVVQQNTGTTTIQNWAFNLEKGVATGTMSGTLTTSTFEHSQRLDFAVTVTQGQDLFDIPPYIRWMGVGQQSDPNVADLVFKAKDGACGVAVVEVRLSDDGQPGTVDNKCSNIAPPQLFQIEVLCVDMAPTYTRKGSLDVDICEDHGLYTDPDWAQDMAGSNGNMDMLQFEIVLQNNDHSQLFLVDPSINVDTGALSFQFRDDENTFAIGEVLAYVRLIDRNTGLASCNPITNCPVLSITVCPKNDPPTAECGQDITICEDLVDHDTPPIPQMGLIPYGLPGFFKGVSVGPTNEGICPGCEGQEINFVTFIDNDPDGSDIFAGGLPPVISDVGDLSFNLRENANGIAVVKVRVTDTGPDDGFGNTNYGLTCTFIVTVKPAADAPTFDISTIGRPNANDRTVIIVDEDDPDTNTVFNDFVFNIKRGGEIDELLRDHVRFDVTYTLDDTVAQPTADYTLFDIPPRVEVTSTTSARLLFSLKPDQCGNATLRIKAVDIGLTDGQINTDCPGRDASDEILVDVVVNCINDPPNFAFGPCPNCCAPTRTSQVVRSSADALQAGSGVWSCPRKLCTITACEDDLRQGTSGGIQGGGFVLPHFIADIDPGGGPDEGVRGRTPQKLRYHVTNDKPDLFITQPAISDEGVLTFAAKKNGYGDVTITVVAEDYIQQSSPFISQRSQPLSFLLRILETNDAPTFTLSDAQRNSLVGASSLITECPMAQSSCWSSVSTNPINQGCSYSIPGFLTGIGPGGGSVVGDPEQFANGLEDDQTYFFQVKVDNPEYFSVLPTITANGVLRFTLAPGSGTTERLPGKLLRMVAILKDDGNSAKRIFDAQSYSCDNVDTTTEEFFVDILPSDNNLNQCFQCNTPPGATVTVRNDQTTFGVLPFASNVLSKVTKPITGGGQDPSTGTTFFLTTIGNTNPGLFTTAPYLSTVDGGLFFDIQEGACGASLITIERSEENTARVQLCSFNIVVTNVNTQPSFTTAGDVESNEDDGEVCIDNYLRDISVGLNEGDVSSECGVQTISFTVDVVTNEDMFLAKPHISPDGRMCFTSKADLCGTSRIKITGKDTGGTLSGGVDTSASQIVELRVLCINDRPTFTRNPLLYSRNIIVCENDGGQLFGQWCLNAIPGPFVNENCPPDKQQKLTFKVRVNDTSLFSDQPQVSEVCTLVFTPAVNRGGGVAEVVVQACDDGPAFPSPPHQPCSLEETFFITILPLQQNPYYDVRSTVITLPEDARDLNGSRAVPINDYLFNIRSGDTFIYEVVQGTGIEDISFEVSGSIATPYVTLNYNAFGTTTVKLCLRRADLNSNFQLSQTFAPSPLDYSGQACILQNGQALQDTFCRFIDVEVLPCNDPPVFIFNNPLVVLEESTDNEEQIDSLFLQNALPGPDNERNQVVRNATVVLPDPLLEQLFLVQPYIVQATTARAGDVWELRYVLNRTAVARVGLYSFNATVLMQDDGVNSVGALGTQVVCNSTHNGTASQNFTIIVKGNVSAPVLIVTEDITYPVNVSFTNTSASIPAADLDAFLSVVNATNGFVGFYNITDTIFIDKIVSGQGLFTEPPRIEPNGSLTFVGGLPGVAVISVRARREVVPLGASNPYVPEPVFSASRNITITLVGGQVEELVVNIALIEAPEDSGYYCVNNVVTLQSYEEAFRLNDSIVANRIDFRLVNCCFGDYAVVPTLFENGTLCFQSKPDYFFVTPSVFVVGEIGNGLNLQNFSDFDSYPTVAIRVTPVNDAPFFNIATTSVTLYEDVGETTLTDFLTNVTPGPREENYQGILFNSSGEVDDRNVFEVVPRFTHHTLGNADVGLKFAADYFTTTAFPLIVSAEDVLSNDELTFFNATNTPLRHTETVFFTVIPINDAPNVVLRQSIFTVYIAADRFDSAEYYDGFRFEIRDIFSTLNPGPSNEWGQRLVIEVTPKRTDLFSIPPVIDQNGTMVFIVQNPRNTPLNGLNNPGRIYGEFYLDIVVHDTGGILHGGIDRTAKRFQLNIVDNFVNPNSTSQNSSVLKGPEIPSEYFQRALVLKMEMSDTPSTSPVVLHPWIDVQKLNVIGFFTFLTNSVPLALSFFVKCMTEENTGKLFLQTPAFDRDGVLSYRLRPYAWGEVTCNVSYTAQRIVSPINRHGASILQSEPTNPAPGLFASNYFDPQPFKIIVQSPKDPVYVLFFLSAFYGISERYREFDRDSDVNNKIHGFLNINEDQHVAAGDARKVLATPLSVSEQAALWETQENYCLLYKLALTGVNTRPLPEEMADKFVLAATGATVDPVSTDFKQSLDLMGAERIEELALLNPQNVDAVVPSLPAVCRVSPYTPIPEGDAGFDFLWVVVACAVAGFCCILLCVILFWRYRRKNTYRENQKHSSDVADGVSLGTSTSSVPSFSKQKRFAGVPESEGSRGSVRPNPLDCMFTQIDHPKKGHAVRDGMFG